MDGKVKEGGDGIRATLGAGNGRPGKWRWAKRAPLLALLLLAGGWAATTGSKKAETVSYVTSEAERGALTVTVSATGNLQPVNSIDIGTEVSGTVKSVEADYNDRVKAGQVLVRLDTEKLEAQLQRSKAALESAQAKLLQAKATVAEDGKAVKRLARAAELSGGKAVSQQDVDTAEAALARAEADEAAAKAAVAEAEANLSADRTNLSKATIRAPIDGIILSRSIEPGQTVAASLSAPVLMTMAENLSRMELHVSVDEADVARVRKGQSAKFTVDSWPDRTFPARITEVHLASTKVNGVVTYETVLLVGNGDGALKPGMTATADITVRKVGDALLVPNAALRFTSPKAEAPGAKTSGGILASLLPHPPRAGSDRKAADARNGDRHQTVYALKDGAPSAISVTVGVTDGKRTEILSGDVKPGMTLVTDIAGDAK